MAIYHANVKTFSRAKGHSSIAAAAYRAGLLLEDERTGLRHDYRRRDGVVETRCIVPDDAPDWALIPAALWTEAEAAERRKDSTIAREFEFALPHELTDEQRSSLATEVTRALVDRYGFAAQASIHSPGSKEGLNWHVHVLATTRRIGPEGFMDKTRELDGGPSGRAEVEWVRELVAAKTNAHLEAANLDVRIDHRSLEVQAKEALARGDLVAAAVLSRTPTRHLGKDASAIESRGGRSELGDRNRSIEEGNQEAFDDLLSQFEQEGRAMATPDSHGEELARREVRRAAGKTLSFSDGEIVMSAGMANAIDRRRPNGADDTGAVSVEALGNEVVQQGTLLQDDLAANGLQVTVRAVRALAFGEVVPQDCKEHRAALSRLLLCLKRFAAALVRFPKRLQAVRRAIRLRHMAEQSWNDFVSNCPEPGVPWVAGDWTQRRGRRLAALEQRTKELTDAQAAVAPSQETALAKELGLRGGELEVSSTAFLDKCAVRLVVSHETPLARSELTPAPALAVSPPTPSPVRRGPRLH
ncbi:MobQ family relaxase [Xanthomonas campestris pv. campestris]|uniref:MobQ family relaxase n=1 Tax=Xanthomonas campestris TaxID=339 RepID=UPI002AD56750|nr:MobQ family relaxase [Xanthomonas campestris]MEA0806213.1 MobQ family relaxase [Xanthomonas campestris pv. campestris]MEB1207217.1 MobQ family relaxase [Xanthomonas campestris pv. campestris]MEB1288772.1 MobQ family relaxase [Xanthomonas campestris pv. campestris]MEB1365428.1 MobQ family relaxase [Xanthomonas campestris pv. campestris]MEB1377666.1 MobQ family relaxase [Xanthomonas campestris pv. campestris]